jgi:hypothetical protein
VIYGRWNATRAGIEGDLLSEDGRVQTGFHDLRKQVQADDMAHKKFFAKHQSLESKVVLAHWDLCGREQIVECLFGAMAKFFNPILNIQVQPYSARWNYGRIVSVSANLLWRDNLAIVRCLFEPMAGRYG